MCLAGKIHVQEIAQKNAIVAWKEIAPMFNGRYVPVYMSDGVDFVRGLNESKKPGFHVYLDKADAYDGVDRYVDNLIKVRIWGRVRFGKQWDCKCASATKMEIDSFKNLIKRKKR